MPSRIASMRAAALPTPTQTINGVSQQVGICNWFTHFKCKSMTDIVNAMKIQPLANNSAQVPYQNQLKRRMYNVKRTHTWRNNNANTPARLEFWTLVLRRDYASTAATTTIAPAPTNEVGAAGAYLENPTMLTQGFDEVDPTVIAGYPNPQPVTIPFYSRGNAVHVDQAHSHVQDLSHEGQVA